MSNLSKGGLKGFLKDIESLRIAVVGDLMLDIFAYGKIERMSPEYTKTPVPVVDISSANNMLGGAGNVARNIKSIGPNVEIFSVVGNDENGPILKKMLREEKIATNNIPVSDRPTTVKKRIVVDEQHIVRIDTEAKHPIHKDLENILIDKLENKIKNIDALIFSDYAKGVITPKLVAAMCKIANKNNVPIIVDTKPSNSKLFKDKNITLITPNTKEAFEISNKQNHDEAGEYFKKHYSASVIITRGHEGMSLYEKDRTVHVGVTSQKVVDVSGCGDTVISILACGLASGRDLEQSMHLANYAAGIVVQKIGTATVTKKEFLNFYEK